MTVNGIKVEPSVRSALVSWMQDTGRLRLATYLVRFRKSGRVRPVTFHRNGCWQAGEVIGR